MKGRRIRTSRSVSDVPTVQQLELELERERYRTRYAKVLRSTVYALVIVAAVAILISTLFLPVLQIYGNSMEPILVEGDIVVTVKSGTLRSGDIISFHYNNDILVKRVIAQAGEWVDIDEEGNVYVNGELLDEPYLTEKAKGECDIVLPYQVPEGRVFVMGDHRSASIDSRSTAIGCVDVKQVVGKLVFRVWPLSSLGLLD